MKPEDPSSDDVERMRDAYRAASDDFDEQPGPRVRRAVLAAAACEVGARPIDTATTRDFAPFGRRRWPLSAAALLVVSIATGVIAARAWRDDPERVSIASNATMDARMPNPSGPRERRRRHRSIRLRHPPPYLRRCVRKPRPYAPRPALIPPHRTCIREPRHVHRRSTRHDRRVDGC